MLEKPRRLRILDWVSFASVAVLIITAVSDRLGFGNAEFNSALQAAKDDLSSVTFTAVIIALSLNVEYIRQQGESYWSVLKLSTFWLLVITGYFLYG